MDIEKLNKKLLEIKQDLENLKNKSNLDGDKDFSNFTNIEMRLKMFIRRIYPNHDEVEKNFFPTSFFSSGMDLTKALIEDIDKAINVINIMIDEFDTFGNDFSPVKETIETSIGFGKNTFGFKKKIKKEK